MKSSPNNNSICIISSAGGHLTEAIKACSKIKHYSTFYVTFQMPHLRSMPNQELYFIENPHIYPWKYLVNFIQSLKLYFKKKPKIIITTGAGIAIAMCVIGKLLGSKVVFIETGARIHQPSRTAKVLYPIADLFIVQWESLLRYFPKAIYGGHLI